MHCPSSNLKLGSGIAPVTELRGRGTTVSLGADGAACNNRLDMFEEMRLAAVLQALRLAPGALPARDVLWMATRDGAKTLGLDHEIGSVDVGGAGSGHHRPRLTRGRVEAGERFGCVLEPAVDVLLERAGAHWNSGMTWSMNSCRLRRFCSKPMWLSNQMLNSS